MSAPPQARGASVTPRPAIVLSRRDRSVLERAVLENLLASPRLAGALLDEILRADVREDHEVGPDIVQLGSRVTFRADGRLRTVRIVGPDDAEVGDDAVSALTSIGAALLGLRPGQAILWPDRVGGQQVLRVVDVRPGSAYTQAR